jgi:hypothetical protein
MYSSSYRILLINIAPLKLCTVSDEFLFTLKRYKDGLTAVTLLILWIPCPAEDVCIYHGQRVLLYTTHVCHKLYGKKCLESPAGQFIPTVLRIHV